MAALSISPAREAEIVEELAQDLEDRRADLVAAGKSAAEADAELLATIDEDLLRELGRLEPKYEPQVAGTPSTAGRLTDSWRDLRYATRALLKSRSFTIVTLLSLALGIGANTAIFQLLEAIHLRDLPVAHADDLATVRIRDRSWASGRFNGFHSDLTNPQWEQLRKSQQAFSSVFAWGDRVVNLNPAGEPHYARGLFVSGQFFDVLAVKPFRGRFFGDAEDVHGCDAPGAVVSYNFWQRDLGGDPDVVGRKISLDGHSVAVLGVTPPRFFGPEIGRFFDVAVPLCMEETVRGDRSMLNLRYGWWLSVMGRLQPGWTVERASAHLDAISKALFEATLPTTYPPDSQSKYLQYRLAAYPGANGISQLREQYSSPLYFLAVIAGLLLLIACANLANLLLARGSTRQREIAVRLALGASRGRLIRQLMAESLLLAVIGAALGLLVARGLGDFMVGFLSQADNTPLYIDLSPNARVIGFAAGLAALTCVLFGLVPAWRASRTDVGLVLKAAGRVTDDHARFGLRRVLVVVQVALSFVLIVGALLFLRSLRALTTADPGFRPSGVMVVGLDLRSLDLPAARRLPLIDDILVRLRAQPGIESATTASIVPISGGGWVDHVWHDGAAKEPIETKFNRTDPGYFGTMGTPLLAGRDFDSHDTLGAPEVAIINQTLARKLHIAGNPVGQRLRREATPTDGERVFEIVGLVRDSKYYELREEFMPLAYLPFAQDDDPSELANVLVRSRLPPADVIGAVKRAAGESSPVLRLQFQTFEDQLRDSLLRDRLLATLASFFGGLAALLATIGLYGVIAYAVSRRTHEIGIRMALGADRGAVIAMIVRESSRLVGVGLVIGVVLALAATRATRALLYGLAPHDPLTFVMAVGLLGAAALLASLLPARRASRVDPMVALRDE